MPNLPAGRFLMLSQEASWITLREVAPRYLADSRLKGKTGMTGEGHAEGRAPCPVDVTGQSSRGRLADIMRLAMARLSASVRRDLGLDGLSLVIEDIDAGESFLLIDHRLLQVLEHLAGFGFEDLQIVTGLEFRLD